MDDEECRVDELKGDKAKDEVYRLTRDSLVIRVIAHVHSFGTRYRFDYVL
jgi:hypothetical protein